MRGHGAEYQQNQYSKKKRIYDIEAREAWNLYLTMEDFLTM